MLEIVSTMLVIVAWVVLILVLVGFVVLWFRERNLPPEEKERRQELRSGMDKQARKFRYAYGLMLFAYLFLLGSIIFASWQGAQERYDQQFESPMDDQNEQQQTQQTANETLDTSDWQTYRNDEFGFEARYPQDWGDVFVEGPGSRVFSSSEDPRVTVQIVTESTKLPLFEILQSAEVGGTIEDNLVFYTKIANESVGGYPAVRYKSDYRNFPGLRFPTGEEVLIKKDGQIFEFRMWGGSLEVVQSNENTFNQILSTFRFVE